jgi:hypothetical protein
VSISSGLTVVSFDEITLVILGLQAQRRKIKLREAGESVEIARRDGYVFLIVGLQNQSEAIKL